MIYKNWAIDDTWRALDELITMLTDLPCGILSLVAPSLGGEVPTRIDDLKAKVKASSRRMTKEQVRWWASFVEQEETSRKTWAGYSPGLAQEHWFLNKFQTHPAAPEPPPDPDLQRQEAELQRLLAKENQFPPVNTILTCAFNC